MIANFFNELFFILQNIFEVLPRDLERSTQDTYIQAVLITGVFYFISRWFKAYILRLILFIIGAIFVIEVLKSPSFLNRFDFYLGLGLLLPHIPIVELSYLILREKVLMSSYKTLAFLQIITSPFVWLYVKFNYFKESNKAKQEEKNYSQEKEQYEQKSREYKKQRQNHHQEQKKQEPPKQKKQKTKEWWESSDNHQVLRVSKNATKAEIKKAYRKLALLYHPDHTLTKKEEHQIIFVKINNAYEALK